MRGSVGGFGMEPEWGGSQSAWTSAPRVFALAKEADPEDEPGEDLEFDDGDLDKDELGAELDEDDLDLDEDDLDEDDLDDDEIDDLDDDLIDLDDEYDTVEEDDRGPTSPRKYDE